MANKSCNNRPKKRAIRGHFSNFICSNEKWAKYALQPHLLYTTILKESFFPANSLEHGNIYDGCGVLRAVSSHMSPLKVSQIHNFKEIKFSLVTLLNDICYNKLSPKERSFVHIHFYVAASLEKEPWKLSFRRRASPGQYMIFVTILSVSLNARKFFELQFNKEGTDYETTSLMEYPPYIVFSNTWQELVVTGALPFIVLLVCNINIYLKIRESSKHESHRYDVYATTL